MPTEHSSWTDWCLDLTINAALQKHASKVWGRRNMLREAKFISSKEANVAWVNVLAHSNLIHAALNRIWETKQFLLVSLGHLTDFLPIAVFLRFAWRNTQFKHERKTKQWLFVYIQVCNVTYLQYTFEGHGSDRLYNSCTRCSLRILLKLLSIWHMKTLSFISPLI